MIVEQVPRVTLTLDEAATACGVSRDSFDRHIRPELRTIRRGKHRLVHVDELHRWARESGDHWREPA